MTASIFSFRERFASELPLWRLRPWQLTLLVCWAAWPWIAGLVFPGNATVAFLPVFVFMPVAYLVGGLFASLFPQVSAAYTVGVSFTIFLCAYLGLVSWRQRRARRNKP